MQGREEHRVGKERMLTLAEVHCHCADSHLNRKHGEEREHNSLWVLKVTVAASFLEFEA